MAVAGDVAPAIVVPRITEKGLTHLLLGQPLLVFEGGDRDSSLAPNLTPARLGVAPEGDVLNGEGV